MARGLTVLAAFRASDHGLTHAEIAARTGLSKATATRLIHTLAETGHLIRDGRGGQFRLGPAVLALGAVAHAQTSFMDLIEEEMQDFANRTGTLAVIGVRSADRMMLVRTWRPVGTASIWLEPGHRVPIMGSSLGQAHVAALCDDAFEHLQPDAALRAFRADGYSQLIARGYTVPREETRFAATIKAVAVPYLAREYGAPISFCCGAMPDMLNDDRIRAEVGPGLVALVRALEAKTGQASALARRG
nr:helix-turn-helix domain-containing protein [Cognatishimia sp. F0-27]